MVELAKKKEKIILTKGKKKTAVARVRIRIGSGVIKINKTPLGILKPAYAKEIILEPIQIAREVLGEDFANDLDIKANVKGGGIMGQAQACRTALGKALVKWSKSDKLKKRYLDYDRSLLIDDIRKKEPKKFLRKGARARPTKSYR